MGLFSRRKSYEDEKQVPRSQPHEWGTEVRQNGIYVRTGRRYSDYLRFQPGGRVALAVSEGNPTQVMRWLDVARQDQFEQGSNYTLDDTALHIESWSLDGVVEYNGHSLEGGAQLELESKSHITGHEDFGRWKFVPYP